MINATKKILKKIKQKLAKKPKAKGLSYKIIYDVTGKTKKQIEAILNLEVENFQRLHPGYNFNHLESIVWKNDLMLKLWFYKY